MMVCCRHVSGSDLLVGGTYVYNHYYDCKDANYLMAGDQILDVTALPQDKVTHITTSIGLGSGLPHSPK